MVWQGLMHAFLLNELVQVIQVGLLKFAELVLLRALPKYI